MSFNSFVLFVLFVSGGRRGLWVALMFGARWSGPVAEEAGNVSTAVQRLRHLRLAAVNIDGVLLNDTFSPVIRQMVVERGGEYTAEVEYALLSQSQLVAARVFAQAAGVSLSPRQVVDAYLEERERYLVRHPVRVVEGAAQLLARLRGLGLRIVCYGGLDRAHFDRHLGGFAEFFDGPRYVCTDGFRPGIREIVQDVFRLPCDRVLVVDDVARVAEEACRLGVPFIGCPGDFEHGHQRALMEEAGVRHLVRSLREIDGQLLRTVDAEAAAGTFWGDTRPPGAAASGSEGAVRAGR
ncbi:HAD family phosphatase [Streptomyces sp. NPDC021080]|uniref:HAD family phosphatase n=1 Tax=Streptomyces sp. NPDC021080 TaxID=3365110 RepID=UPI0037B71944